MFSTAMASFYIPTSMQEGSNFSTFLPSLAILFFLSVFVFFHDRHPNICEGAS